MSGAIRLAAQVLATETARPSEIRESSGELIVRDDSMRAFWSDDSLQDEPKSYLLPSDQFAGPSIAAGHLKLYTRWRGDRTKISHGLTGEDSGITHQIEFLSVELEKFEADIRGVSK